MASSHPPHRTYLFTVAAGLIFLALTAAVTATVPNAPSNVRAALLDSSNIALGWDDNSTNETNFQVGVYTNSNPEQFFSFAANTTGRTFGPISSLAAAAFEVRSFIGNTNPGNVSAFTPLINFTVHSAFKDQIPTFPILAPQPDGSLLFLWTDASAAEAGYLVEISTNGVNYSSYGSTGPNFTGLFSGPLAPATTYFFRVKGFQGASGTAPFTDPSTPISATTPATLNAPTGLVATAIAPTETSASFAFSDNTALNTNYELEYGLHGSGTFVVVGDAGDNNTLTATSFFAPGTAYDFRLRAYYDDGTHTNLKFSGYSNTATLTTPFNPPTGLSAATVSDTQVNLTWADNSQAEGGYSIYVRTTGSSSFTLYGFTAVNATSFSVTGLSPGTAYDFQVAAAFQRSAPGASTLVESTRSNTSSATTKDGFTSPALVPVSFGQPFNYQAVITGSGQITLEQVFPLPTGLSFNAGTGVITGTPTQSGLFTVILDATFSGGWVAHRTITLRIVKPPTAPVMVPMNPTQTLTLGDVTGGGTISASDPDVESAVRLVTTKGNIDVLLYGTETPQTVTNFLGYVNRGDYNNSVFHRISDLATSGVAVLQGGEFKSAATAPDAFTSIPVPQVDTLPNEPGISNLNYTIAMAKSGGDPNSASSQFYFNLTDVDSVLDSASQNGGFTVFGRVSGLSKATVDAISTSPTGGPYNITADGSTINQGFKWPMNVPNQASVPATMDNTKVMTIISAAPLTNLVTYSASSSNPAVATASVAGNALTITQAAAGTTVVTVTATDLDGLTATQTINVTVNESLAHWASTQGLTPQQSDPSADPDKDGHTNLEEFALMTNPGVPNNPGAASYTLADAAGVKFGQITFPVRKFAPTLTYTVEVSDTLMAGSWTPLWTSANGFNASVVKSAVDQTDRTILTVQDTQPSPPATHRFLRVSISSP